MYTKLLFAFLYYYVINGNKKYCTLFQYLKAVHYIILYCYIKDCKSVTLEAFSPVRLHDRINYFQNVCHMAYTCTQTAI